MLRKRNMSFSKRHCCYIILSAEFKENHTLEQDSLLCCVIISSGLKERLFKEINCCHSNLELKGKKNSYVTKMKECREKEKQRVLLLSMLSTYLRISSLRTPYCHCNRESEFLFGAED